MILVPDHALSLHLLQDQRSKYTTFIKTEARRLGFDFCGISKADFLEAEAPRLESWLSENKHGEMKYMENYFDKRLDPRLLVEGAKSVISLLLNYYPAQQQAPHAPKISKYAYGDDYHLIIRDKLNALLASMREDIGDIGGRAFVDSAPVLEKAWAAKSGLGWIGKNSNLLTRNGSFFFIAEIICDLELEVDGPMADYCGTCTRCIDACPTNAIDQPYGIDASKCISYLTIELRDQIPDKFAGQMEGWAFGCDICQDVCPWNSFSAPHSEPLLSDRRGLLSMKESEWLEITDETFGTIFRNSAVKRTKFKGLKRNLEFLRKQRLEIGV